jgi:uncharacterized protein
MVVQSDRLILFSRYPIAGQAKTRLIPALGATGAAQLQRQMTEWTFAMAMACAVSVQICFCGGTIAQMRQWLGDGPDYQPQGDGDLGERMARAVESALAQGYQRVVIIGTDCPAIDQNLVREAFDRLHQNDLVLGAAADGGYYLIGLRRWVPEIFQAIPWSSELVLTKTLAIADTLAIPYDVLKVLPDIDRPEDLPHLPPLLYPDRAAPDAHEP